MVHSYSTAQQQKLIVFDTTLRDGEQVYKDFDTTHLKKIL